MKMQSFLVQLVLIVAFFSATLASAEDAVPAFKELDEADWSALNASPGILSHGAQASSVQVVFDPDCPASARLFDYVQLRHPNTPMRWVPIAHFRETSLGRSAALLQATDPAQALISNFSSYDYTLQRGAIDPAVPSSALRSAMMPVNERVQQWLGGTPVIVVRSAEGRVMMNQLGNRAVYIDALIERADGLKDFRP